MIFSSVWFVRLVIVELFIKGAVLWQKYGNEIAMNVCYN